MATVARLFKRILISFAILAGLWVFYVLTPESNLERLRETSKIMILPSEAAQKVLNTKDLK